MTTTARRPAKGSTDTALHRAHAARVADALVERHTDGTPVAAPADATAEHVAAVARAWRDNRVATEEADLGDWSDPDAGRRYVEVLRGLTFTPVGDRYVAAVAPDTADGHLWGYTGSSCLDWAAQVLTDAHITDVDDRAALLRWDAPLEPHERPSEELLPSDFDATV